MSQNDITPTSFTSYNLTEEQIRQGSILTPLQRQVIQNELATAAEEKIHLKFDYQDPIAFAQNEAYLSGRLETLQGLLAQSEYASDPKNYQEPTQDF